MQLHQAKPNIAIVLTDAKRHILWVNEVFTELTGYTLEEVMHKKPSVLQGTGSSPEVILEMRHCLENAFPFQAELTNYRKNGEPYTCRLAVHPILDKAGHLTNFIAFEVDASLNLGTPSDLDLLGIAKKYQTSSLKGEKSVALYDRLMLEMDSNQLYLDSSLNLPQLADTLKTNTKYLSQVVNHHYGDNLQQFVNQYRVDAAKEKLQGSELEHLTYFAIGQRCGFKNKSTFYKVFKKFTGQTPHEYVLSSRADQQPKAKL